VKPRALEWLACPICGSELDFASIEKSEAADAVEEPASACRVCHAPDPSERAAGDGVTCSACHAVEIIAGTLKCGHGHIFPIRRGVPRMLENQRLASSSEARMIKESFSREWGHFDYERDRTWGESVDQRRIDFLRHVDHEPDELKGKLVLDAGCGNGVLSNAISTFGCEVVATDISESVETAHRYFSKHGNGRTHFVQSDLMRLSLKPESFDVIFCAGVLHHTPNTRNTFEEVVKALAPGGRMFVWLYWDVPGIKPKLSELVRRTISPLPAPLKHGVVWALLPQNLLRQYIRSLRAGTGREGRLNWREVLVRMLDSYTPRYRWRHTPDAVHGWFRELGFTDVKTTERGSEGFGVAARKPARRSNRTISPLVTA
jgi:ubiquinone/menaquinone biosynthesis C-methylase UbiE